MLVAVPGISADPACGPPFVTTYQVQGVGDKSELEGQSIVVEAIVTGDFRGVNGSLGRLDAVFVQDQDGDQDERTSDGLLVYLGGGASLPVTTAFAPGQRLRIRGTVREYEGETQLEATDIVSCGSGVVPQVTDLEFPLVASRRFFEAGWVGDLEALEGMLIRLPAGLRISDKSAEVRYGEVTLVDGEPPWVFTHEHTPDAMGFVEYEQRISRRTVIVDDGSDELYPRTATEGQPSVLGGALASPLVGALREPRGDASLGQAAYRVAPTGSPQWAAVSGEKREVVAGKRAPSVIRIVAVNLHNLFKDGGDGGQCYPSFTASDCRGETTHAGRAAHQAESARQIAVLSADIIAASEVQNDFGAQGETTWESWVDDLNDAVADLIMQGASEDVCAHYLAVAPGVYVGGDAIAVALAYCAERVELETVTLPTESQLAEWGSGVFSGPNSSRLPLAGTFRRLDGRGPWTVVANHLKSRSPGALQETCPTSWSSDCDQGDGQGYWSDARTKASSSLARWLEQWTSSPVLVVGDLNAYPQESPIEVLQDNELHLLTGPSAVQAPSYVFNGRLGVLDHLLVSREHLHLVEQVGLSTVNVGPGIGAIVYSDHNPVFVDLDLDAVAECDCAAEGAVVGTPQADVLVGTPGNDVLCGLGGDDVLLGLGGVDCISGGLGEDRVFVPEVEAGAGRLEGEQVTRGSTATSCDL